MSSTKDTVNKSNRWEKIITTLKTDKGFVSRIIKQFLKINKKEDLVKNMNRQVTEEEAQITYALTEKSPVSQGIQGDVN